MIGLAFLTDAPVVERILRHLGLPWSAPALLPARSVAPQPVLDPLSPEVAQMMFPRSTAPYREAA
jgi:hypothetical protein